MDLCHCVEPAPERNEYGSLVCLNCRLFYDEREWKSDARVKEAQDIKRLFSKKQQDLIDMIMKEGLKHE